MKVPKPRTMDAPYIEGCLTQEDALQHARVLEVLAHPTRLNIVSLLSRHDGRLSVTDLTEALGLIQPTLSHHLAILRDAGVIESRKECNWTYYSVRSGAIQVIINSLITLIRAQEANQWTH